jgi:CelD/BcsL family acetyltransferase involved in cellulose biosynthesis
MPLEATIIDDEAGLGEISERWESLAVDLGRPNVLPGWMLAWWRNARPAGAALRVVAVTDGQELLGLAPLCALDRGRYEMLTGQLSPPVGPLLARERTTEVAEALARGIAGLAPPLSSLRIEDVEAGSGVPSLVGSWPRRRPWLHSTAPIPLPMVTFGDGDYEAWLGNKSSKFRREMKRKRRRLEDEGAAFVLAEGDGIAPGVDAFIRLHGGRWEDRGSSNALIDGLRPMLIEAGTELSPKGQFRLFTIEVDGRVVAISILLAAGGSVCGWSSGFDEEWGKFSPSMVLTLHAMADAAGRGESEVCLGPGAGGYKRQLMDHQDAIALTTLVPRGSGYPLARLRLAPYQARWAASARLSPETKQKLKKLAGR